MAIKSEHVIMELVVNINSVLISAFGLVSGYEREYLGFVSNKMELISLWKILEILNSTMGDKSIVH